MTSVNFFDGMYVKPPRRIYKTMKTMVKLIDDTWSLDLLLKFDSEPRHKN